MLLEEGIKLLKNNVEIKTKECTTALEKIKAVILIQVKVTVQMKEVLKYMTLLKAKSFPSLAIAFQLSQAISRLQTVLI